VCFSLRQYAGASLVRVAQAAVSGVVTSDRAKAYDTRPLGARQLCWAHLRKEFQAVSDRGGAARAMGEILREHSTVLFARWHRVREGAWARSTFQWHVGPLRQSFRDELARGSRCPKTAATWGRNVLSYLTACCRAVSTKGRVPSLLPQTSS